MHATEGDDEDLEILVCPECGAGNTRQSRQAFSALIAEIDTAATSLAEPAAIGKRLNALEREEASVVWSRTGFDRQRSEAAVGRGGRRGATRPFQVLVRELSQKEPGSEPACHEIPVPDQAPHSSCAYRDRGPVTKKSIRFPYNLAKSSSSVTSTRRSPASHFETKDWGR